MSKVVFGELKKRWFHFIVKTKNSDLNIWKRTIKAFKFDYVHFKTRNFNIRGSPVTDKDITFESDKILNPLEITGLHFLAKLPESFRSPPKVYS